MKTQQNQLRNFLNVFAFLTIIVLIIISYVVSTSVINQLRSEIKMLRAVEGRPLAFSQLPKGYYMMDKYPDYINRDGRLYYFPNRTETIDYYVRDLSGKNDFSLIRINIFQRQKEAFPRLLPEGTPEEVKKQLDDIDGKALNMMKKRCLRERQFVGEFTIVYKSGDKKKPSRVYDFSNLGA